MAQSTVNRAPAGTFKSNTSHHSYKQGMLCKVRLFRLDDIPLVMDNLKWTTAAKLMRRWFDAPAYEMSEKEKQHRVSANKLLDAHLDKQIVRMAWALRFSRIKEKYDTLIQPSYWNSIKGQAELKDKVKEAFKIAHTAGQCTAQGDILTWRFGDLNADVTDVETLYQINVVALGGMLDELDDYYGAIGEAQFKLAVSGKVTTTTSHHQIHIDSIGVYLHDTYEFINDAWHGVQTDQPLGHWGFGGVRSKASFIAHLATAADVNIGSQWKSVSCDVVVDEQEHQRENYFDVQNSDFQKYRAKYGKGGDFTIFSDVKVSHLHTPIIFQFAR